MNTILFESIIDKGEPFMLDVKSNTLANVLNKLKEELNSNKYN